MKETALLLACALVLGMPGLAAADGGSYRDPDEQPFCESPDPCPDTDYMDFRKVTFGHGERANLLRHGIETRERWKTKEMGGPHGVSFYVAVNTDGDERVERLLHIRRKHGRLWARMFRGAHHRKKIAVPLRVWRPDRRSLKVRLPVRVLGDDVDRYRYRWSWANRAIACPGSCSTDHAPNNGWYEHVL